MGGEKIPVGQRFSGRVFPALGLWDVGPLPGPGAVCDVEELGLQPPPASVGIVPTDPVLSSPIAPTVLGGMGRDGMGGCTATEMESLLPVAGRGSQLVAGMEAGWQRANIPRCAQGVEALDKPCTGARSLVLASRWG